MDKLTTAALGAVLGLYADPDRLSQRLPIIRLLSRPATEIRAAAQRLLPAVASAVDGVASARVVACDSQVGSGALPTRTIPSAGLEMRPLAKRGKGKVLQQLAAVFRALPTPVIGRIQEDAFLLDLRCLDDEAAFETQVAGLTGHWNEVLKPPL